MRRTLNDDEKTVLDNCQRASDQSDNEREFTFEDLMCCIDDTYTENEVKGYLSQLTQKGYINKMEGCYFDFEINRKG